jgi:hypothetical protein
MTSIRFTLSALWRSLSLVVAAFACAFVLFSNVTPAYSLPNPFAPDKPAQTSDSTKGEDQLLGIEEGAQKTAIRQAIKTYFQVTKSYKNPMKVVLTSSGSR